MSNRHKYFYVEYIALAISAAILTFLLSDVRSEVLAMLLPTLAIVLVFLLFLTILNHRLGENIIFELGTMNLGFLVAYSAVPGLLGLAGLADDNPLSTFFLSQQEIGAHLWRHVLFAIGIAIGYLAFRGSRQLKTFVVHASDRSVRQDRKSIVISIIVIVISMALMNRLSGPVDDYWSHYTRYDHLPIILRKVISICVRLSWGFNSVLLTLMFLNFRRYKNWIPIVAIVICLNDILYSHGARIQTLIILFTVLCLYGLYVSKVSITKVLGLNVIMLILFTIVEVSRVTNDDLGAVLETMRENGFRVAGEFGAVFYTGFHLYTERTANSLPEVEWPMFFSDIWALVPFFDFSEWNPMHWYYQNYHPDAPAAPFTLGPIANSALWGGEIDLFIRGILSGTFLAFLTRWFISLRRSWWAAVIYVYFYATCILCLKYSIFFHTQLLVKTLLPVLLLTWVFRKINFTLKPLSAQTNVAYSK